MLCSTCGKQMDDGSAFCSGCGAPAARVASRSTANLVVIIVVAAVAVLGILAIGGIVAAVVIPNIVGANTRAQEMTAILNVRSINTAQVQYYSEFGRYAKSLSELGPPSNGKEGPASAGLIPADLAAGTKGGYTFTLRGSSTGYTVNANPVKYGSTGSRTFFSDESLVIRANSGPEPATAASGEVK
jgi:type IV pilus assembly protein PilA